MSLVFHMEHGASFVMVEVAEATVPTVIADASERTAIDETVEIKVTTDTAVVAVKDPVESGSGVQTRTDERGQGHTPHIEAVEAQSEKEPQEKETKPRREKQTKKQVKEKQAREITEPEFKARN